MGVTNSNKVISTDRIACDGSLRVTPALTAAPDILTNPTDIVLVLDRSGSMAGAARLFRHAVASPGALRRGPPVGWHRTYTILRSPGTRRISHAAPSASANTASSQTSAAAREGSAPHSGRNSRSCVWAISQSCAR